MGDGPRAGPPPRAFVFPCRIPIMCPRLLILPAATLLMAACATTPGGSADADSAGVLATDDPAPVQMAFTLASGTYRCEQGLRVDVQRAPGAGNSLEVSWKGRRYHMVRNLSHSGLPRFEDPASGLVWIDLPWKSVLLDGGSGKPLASECRGTAVSQRG